MRAVLGLSAFYHDSAAAILVDGEIIAAAQEERFTRKKHDKSFPSQSIKYCLREAKITPKQVSEIVFYEQPKLKLDRLFKTYLAFAPRGWLTFIKVVSDWFGGKINQKKLIENGLNEALEEMNNKSPEWNEQLSKYLEMMIHSDNREAIIFATEALGKLLEPEPKTLGFSKPMFSQEEEMLSDEYSEKAGKRLHKLLSSKKK